MRTFLFIALQYLIPQHALSRLVGAFASTRIRWIKGPFIRHFIARYHVDMREAADSDPESYACFNDFFCRALKPDARPMDDTPDHWVSPADGAFSQLGDIDHGRIFQAKGRNYSANELLGGDEAMAARFAGGKFATIYLSPKDYHRLHMPCDGTLVAMLHVPGALFSVNPATVDNVDRLFARNERVVCLFDTASGPMALVLVGAMIVASVETVWAGLVAPAGKQVTRFHYQHTPISLKKGEEFARFKLGSTIIILLPEATANWLPQFAAHTPVRLGQAIARPHEVAA